MHSYICTPVSPPALFGVLPPCPSLSPFSCDSPFLKKENNRVLTKYPNASITSEAGSLSYAINLSGPYLSIAHLITHDTFNHSFDIWPTYCSRPSLRLFYIHFIRCPNLGIGPRVQLHTLLKMACSGIKNFFVHMFSCCGGEPEPPRRQLQIVRNQIYVYKPI